MNAHVHYREGTAADRDAILALRTRVFAGDDVEKQQPEFWDWEFVDGYAGAARVFVAEEGDRIVSHLGFVPQIFEAGQAIRGALAVDAMTDPDHRRQRVFGGLATFAANAIRDDYRVVTAFQIRPPVLGGMLSAGWSARATIPVLLRPVSLRHIARDFGLPAGSWRAAERRTDAIRVLERGDLEQVDRLLVTSAARQPRSAEFLDWRYRRNRHWRYEMRGVFERNELRAFLVHRESTLRGLRSVAIADAGVLPGGEASLRSLVAGVCRMGRDSGAGVAAAFLSRAHPAYRPLRRCGFIPGPHRFRLLLQIFDESLRRLDDAPWSLSWGDTDHL